jgi:glutamate dehydrogenase (NADP+)
MLKVRKETMEGKTCLVSGSGNVAIYTIEKVHQLGGKVVACSDSNGVVYDEKGIDLELVKQLKEVERRRIRDYAAYHKHVKYVENGNIWEIPCQIAFPSATQNEINGKDAAKLVKNGCIAIGEGANMPTTPEGVRIFLEAKIAYGPAKAANAGGVATSALEMQQNACRDAWTFEYTEKRLAEIMKNIHTLCYETAEEFGTPGNLVNGANIAGFIKVAKAMVALGLV